MSLQSGNHALRCCRHAHLRLAILLSLAGLLLLAGPAFAGGGAGPQGRRAGEVVVLYSQGTPALDVSGGRSEGQGIAGRRLRNYDFSAGVGGAKPGRHVDPGLRTGLQNLARRHRLLGVQPIYQAPAGRKLTLKGGMTRQGSNAQTIEGAEIHCLVFPSEADLVQCAAELKRLPGVALAEPNQEGALTHIPTDPLYPQTAQDLGAIHIEQAWDVQRGADPSVVVAVIDSGVETVHPEFAGVLDLANSYNFADGNTHIFDDLGHGTRVAGIIAAAGGNGVGIAGVGFGCRVMSLDVTTSAGVITTGNVAAAILWARDHGAQIINMSLRFQAPSQVLEAACDAARDAGCLLVAAAGNENQGLAPVYPASYDSVLAVGAVGGDGATRAPWSNYNGGKDVKIVDLVAPGTTIFSCIPGGQYNGTYGSGTSFAAPMASGVAALLKTKYPTQSGVALGQQLRATAERLGNWAGAGRLNAQAALATALVPSFAVASVRVDDAVAYGGTNDNDGYLEPGEKVKLYVTLKNSGADADGVQATLSGGGADVTLGDVAGGWGRIVSAGSAENTTNSFDGVTLAAGAAAQDARFHLALSANYGTYTQGLDFTVPTERLLIPPAFITADTTWTRNNTYKIVRNTVVNPGVKLTIEPGTTIKFNDNGRLEVQGTLDARGLPDKKIRFTNMSETKPGLGYDSELILDRNSNGFLKIGDIDNNGVPDIYFGQGSLNYWIAPKGNLPKWSTINRFNQDGSYWAAQLRDLDHDGANELILYGSDYIFRLYHWSNRAWGSQEIINKAAMYYGSGCAWEDIDSDNSDELFVIWAPGSGWHCFIYKDRHDKNGYVQESAINLDPYQGVCAPGLDAFTFADINNDQRKEFLFAYGASIECPHWDGANYIRKEYPIGGTGGKPFVFDIDHDGKKEVVSYIPATHSLSILKWVNNDFAPYTSITLPNGPADFYDNLKIADLNKDGYEDILYLDIPAGKYFLYPGKPSGGFETQAILMGSHLSTASNKWEENLWTIGDLDGDGYLDIIENTSQGICVRYLNPNSQQMHLGLWIRNTATTSKFKNCEILYGPLQDDSADSIWEDSFFIQNNCFHSPVPFAATFTAGSQPIVRCCAQDNHNGGGINAGPRTMVDCEATGNWGIGLQGSAMTGCIAKSNLRIGIQATGDVTSCTAEGNTDWGIKASGTATSCTVRNNTNGLDAANAINCNVTGNEQTGIQASGTVTNCRAELNGGIGLTGAGSFSDCVVVGNGAGVTLTGSATRCTIAGNPGNGVNGGTVVDSVIAGNTGTGVNAPESITGSYIVGNQVGGIFNISGSGGVHGSYIAGNGGTAGFDYRDSRLSSVLALANLAGNYWGPATTALMNAHPWGSNFNIPVFYDFWDDDTLTEADYRNHLTSPPANTQAPPFLLTVTPTTATAVGVGVTTFTLTYNRAMDTKTNPSVTFGLSAPYDSYVVEPTPGWISPTVWRGSFAVQSGTQNGQHTLRVTGARGANGFAVPDDTRNPFRVDTSGGGSANNGMATSLGKRSIKVTWSENGRSATTIGYTILRSTTGIAGSFVRINSVPVTVTEYIDNDIIPDQAYYYIIDTVDSNSNSNQWTEPTDPVSDDDGGGSSPQVQFSETNSMIAENGGTTQISLSLSQSCLTPVTVQYSVGGTALGGGSDYQDLPGAVTFEPGQTTQQIAVPIVDDTRVEADETVELTLVGASGAELGSNTGHTLTIIDDDYPTVSFLAAAESALENAGRVACQVALSEPIDRNVTVQYTIGGSAVSGADYEALPGSVTFAPGQTRQTIPIDVIDDTVVEMDETVVLSLTDAVNATVTGIAQYTLKIQDNDLPKVSFAAASSSIGEGGGTARIAVNLSTRTNLPVTVNYSLGGAATGGGSDYVNPSGTLTFYPTETVKYIDLPIVDDALVEPDETVVLTLTGAVNATLDAPAQHTLTIMDNDLPTVRFSSFFSEASEGWGGTTVTLELSHAPYRPVDVYVAFGGTAQGGGADYVTPPGTVAFGPLETVKALPIRLINDTVVRGDRDIILTITGSSRALLGAPVQHTLVIHDDDAATSLPVVSFALAASALPESGGTARVQLKLTRPPGDPGTSAVTVRYALSGTATPGLDYAAPPGSVTFAAGQTTASLAVAVLDDALAEPDETVRLTLTGADGALVGGILEHTLTILDNDRQVTLAVGGGGSGRVSSGGQMYNLPWSCQVQTGATVGLRAVADAGWAFAGWSGDPAAAGNPTTLTMSQSRSLTALFTHRARGDFNASGGTDLSDFLFLLDHWQQPFDGAVVGTGDFLALLDNWNQKGYGKPQGAARAESIELIWLNPAGVTLGVGEPLCVAVHVDTLGQGTRGGAVTILYDPAALEVLGAEAAAGSPFALTPAPAWSQGRLELCLSRPDFALVPYAGAVATVRLKALRPLGMTELSFDDTLTRLSPASDQTQREGARYRIDSGEKTAVNRWRQYP